MTPTSLSRVVRRVSLKIKKFIEELVKLRSDNMVAGIQLMTLSEEHLAWGRNKNTHSSSSSHIHLWTTSQSSSTRRWRLKSTDHDVSSGVSSIERLTFTFCLTEVVWKRQAEGQMLDDIMLRTTYVIHAETLSEHIFIWVSAELARPQFF